MAYVFNPFTGKLDVVAGIGDVLSGGTAGSVLFVGVGGILAQDNANFFYDDANNELRLGGLSTQNSKFASRTEAADAYNVFLDSSTTPYATSRGSFTGLKLNGKTGSVGTPISTYKGFDVAITEANAVSSVFDEEFWETVGCDFTLTKTSAHSYNAAGLTPPSDSNVGMRFSVNRSGTITANGAGGGGRNIQAVFADLFSKFGK